MIHRDRVYIGNGQDSKHGEGVGHFYGIDATKRGDITETGRLFHVDIRRTVATAAVTDDLVYISDFSGFLHCIDTKTGKEVWTHDLFASMWASPLLIDGQIYLGNVDGDVYIMQAGREKKELARINMRRDLDRGAGPWHAVH